MRRPILCLALLAPLAACGDPILSTEIVIGPDGARLSPGVSIGPDGGGRITYSPF